MIAFFVMNQKGFYVIKSFLEKYGPQIVDKIISHSDSNLEEDYYHEIRSLCQRYGVPFHNKEDHYDIESEYVFAIGWRWLIKNISGTIIVFHDSLLPRYRGFAPLVSCLINGEKKIGVTGLFASDKYDCGKIIDQDVIEIEYPITITQAIEHIQISYFNVIERITDKILNGEVLEGVDQNEEQASYSLWRDDEDYRIDWSWDAGYIRKFVDAVCYPYKGAYSFIQDRKIRILKVQEEKDLLIEDRDRMVGKVIFQDGEFPIVVCGKGLIKIIEAVDNESRRSVLPLSSFRSRFT